MLLLVWNLDWIHVKIEWLNVNFVLSAFDQEGLNTLPSVHPWSIEHPPDVRPLPVEQLCNFQPALIECLEVCSIHAGRTSWNQFGQAWLNSKLSLLIHLLSLVCYFVCYYWLIYVINLLLFRIVVHVYYSKWRPIASERSREDRLAPQEEPPQEEIHQ